MPRPLTARQTSAPEQCGHTASGYHTKRRQVSHHGNARARCAAATKNGAVKGSSTSGNGNVDRSIAISTVFREYERARHVSGVPAVYRDLAVGHLRAGGASQLFDALDDVRDPKHIRM